MYVGKLLCTWKVAKSFFQDLIPDNTTVEYSCSLGHFDMFNTSDPDEKINGSSFSITCVVDTLTGSFAFEGEKVIYS